MSVKFVSAILGPEMAAPILWAHGKMRSFWRKTYVHKIPRGGYFGLGGSADFIFMDTGIFLKKNVVDFRWQTVCQFSPGKLGSKFVAENFTAFFRSWRRQETRILLPGTHSGSIFSP